MEITDTEATMEMVLPLFVTDVMQTMEDQGKHPEADFTQKLRAALLQVVPNHPEIEQDVWDLEKKKIIIEEISNLLDL